MSDLTRKLRMIVDQRTGECVSTMIAKPHLDLSGLPGFSSADPDRVLVAADVVYQAEPEVDGTLVAGENVDPLLRKHAAYLLDFAEKAFGLVDCGMSIQGNRIKVFGGRTNPVLLDPRDDIPF